jgi:tetratricopeptide (TPR) repeat protein
MMNSTSKRVNGPRIALALTSAMGAVLLSGCTTQGGMFAGLGNGRAEAPLAKAHSGRAVANAEAAVAADPRNAAYRAMLGAAYLEAGRFSSAVTSFDDAMTLGDKSAGTALRMALALTGEGKHPEALAVLNDWSDSIPPADLGLAYALASQPARGIQIMADAIRAGDGRANTRQNLAYALALNGQWREARVMAAQDVPADKLGARMEEWALMTQPEAWQLRVAALLGAPTGVADIGQPAYLALNNTPGVEQLAAEAAPYVSPEPVEELAVAEPAPAELSPLAAARVMPVDVEPSKPADDFGAAFAAVTSVSESVAQMAQDAVRFVQQPVVQAFSSRAEAAPATIRIALPEASPVHAVPTRATPGAAAPARAATVAKADGTHLVQLGSFGSEDSARRAWSIYTKRYPELAGHKLVISEAVVGGKRYWRVSAGGFDNAGSQGMCGRVKGRGEGCFAYAEGRPLPGAVDTGVRLASR